jgi:non-specific serine/threonine protein kinase
MDFDRLRRLVVDALDIPTEERDRFLRERCDDPGLIEAAGKLLQHDTASRTLHDVEDAVPADDESVPSGDDAPYAGDPSRIGRYTVSRRIAEGGMGIVYLATDPTLDRQVAVKQLPDWLAREPGVLDRFREEARILAQLNHPNIATIYSLESDADRWFLTMEFLSGESLAETLSRGPLELDSALHIIRGIAGALEAAHAKGIAHRDLKPHNIMITGDGDAKVLDFGLAVRIGDRTPEHAGAGPSPDAGPQGGEGAGWTPRSWASAGTPGYMSPERIRGMADDIAGDTWSFGCVLFECLAGVRAFGGEREERIRRTLHDAPRLDALPAATPPPLQKLIEQCLVKNPEQRLASLRKARRVVEAAIERRERDRLGVPQRRAVPLASLPHYLSRFLGRERELADVRARLRDHRLVTLVGFGGCGKTRLAVESLLQSAWEAVWVDLTPIENPDQVTVAILSALNVHTPANDPVQQLIQILADSDLVLLLDNCEHLLAACREISPRLLGPCPGLRVLATSREPLEVEGEVVIALAPLPMPEAATSGVDNPSMQLFLDRARAMSMMPEPAGPTIATVAAICRRLEGIPLALEIAASQLDVLSLGELLDRLERRLELSQSSRDQRHHSLRAVIDSSFKRLRPLEQSLLCRMSVFPGSWTMDAAEAVGMADAEGPWHAFEIVKALARKSLVQRVHAADAEAPSRFRILETVAEFARERLRAEDGGETNALLAMVRYYRDMLVESGVRQAEVWRAARRFRVEEDNISRAVDAAGKHLPAEEHADFVAGLAPYWKHCGRYQEGLRRCREALAALDRAETDHPRILCVILLAQAEFLAAAGPLAQSEEAGRRAHELAVALRNLELQARALNVLGNAERSRDRLPEALAYYDRGLVVAQADENPFRVATIRFNRGVILLHLARTDEAEAEFRESLRSRQLQGDEAGASESINALGVVASVRGCYEEARRHYEESLAIKRRTEQPQGMVTSFVNLSRVTINLVGTTEDDVGLLAESRAYCDEGLVLAKQIGDRRSIATLYLSRASAESLEGNVEAAERAGELGVEAARAAGSVRYEAAGFDVLAKVALQRGDHGLAQSRAETSLGLFLKGEPASVYQPLVTMAYARFGLGDARGALILLAASRVTAARASARQPKRDEESDARLETTIAGLLDAAAFQDAVRIGETTPIDRIVGEVQA